VITSLDERLVLSVILNEHIKTVMSNDIESVSPLLRLEVGEAFNEISLEQW
jgi:hypothetical protein